MKGTIYVTALLALGACGDGDEDKTFEEGVVQQQAVSATPIHISDEPNPDSDSNDPAGTNGFFLYAPMAPTQPALPASGFNGSFASRMRTEIRDTACTGDNDSTGAVRKSAVVVVFPTASPPTYKSQFNNVASGLVVGNCYRVAIILDNEVLGFRDAHLVATAQTPSEPGYKKWVVGQNQQVTFGIFGDLDDDDDTILNHTDNCRADANTDQADADNDGIGDACEPPADGDGDNVPDANDNCPNAFNPGQEDADGDLLGDACDGCPADPTKGNPGICGCGVSDADGDGDGAADCIDACPADPSKSLSPGVCGCGISDADSDGDGTADCNDACPTDAGKTSAGQCGCGVPDADADNDGRANCVETCDPFAP